LLTPEASLWLGLRTTRLKRQSIATDGSNAIDTSQAFTTPWLAASLQVDVRTLVYASAGEGVESAVAPNLPTYINAGQVLPAQKSRQLEAGVKVDGGDWNASAAVFDIRRPFVTDSCTPDCTRLVDGQQRHRGVEVDAQWRGGPWSLQAGGTLLRAARERSANAADDDLKPTNVPEHSLRAALGYQPSAVPGLTLGATVSYESSRFVLPENTASVPSWTRLDLSARWVQRLAVSQTLTWRLGVDNATDKRAWRESPFQFGHVYLYPLAPRTWRGSVQATF
jgi:iron complex outermembrane receptor protein